MEAFEYPAFIRNLPEADLPGKGLVGWLLQGQEGLVMFSQTDVDLNVPEHAHGDQWVIVLDGKIEVTYQGETHTYTRGDAFFIGAGTPHRASMTAGFRAVDFFADRDRYLPRPTE